VIGQARRPAGEDGARLDRELVMGEMCRTERQRLLQVTPRRGEVLAGEAVHQIDVEILEPGGVQLRRGAPGLVRTVNAPERRQARIVEGLRPEGDPTDAGRAVL